MEYNMTVLKTAAGVMIGVLLANYITGFLNLMVDLRGWHLYPFIQ